MSERKHTPGPWRVLEGKHGLQIHGGQHWIANMKCESTPFAEEANALLIAAAPDMLEALEAAKGALDTPLERRRHGENPFYRETVDLIRAALAKAKGQTP